MDFKNMDVTDRFDVQRLINLIEDPLNIERKKNALKAWEICSGLQRKYVKEELFKIYPETHDSFRVGDVSLAKKVISKISKAYQRNPMRDLGDTAQNAFLNEIYDIGQFNRAFQCADEIFNLHRYVVMWITYVSDQEKYILQALQPYEYDLFRDPITGEPLIFSMSYNLQNDISIGDGSADGVMGDEEIWYNSKRYVFWTTNQYSEWISRKSNKGETGLEMTVIEGNLNNINELEMLPIAWLTQDPSVDYPIRSNLSDQSIDWNLSLSDLKTSASAQGHGQLVIKHPEEQEIGTLRLGMRKALLLPQIKDERSERQNTEASFINANADLMGQLEILKFDALNILEEHGIKVKNSLQSGVSIESGIAKAIAESDVQDKIESNQKLYEQNLEQPIFILVKRIEEVLAKGASKITSDNVRITFEKPKILISDKETLENIEKRIQLGTLLPHEKHMILNPNLDETQAIEREKKIIEQKMIEIQMIDALSPKEDEDLDEDLDEEAPSATEKEQN